MALEYNPEQTLAAKIERLRQRQHELTPTEQNELDHLSKHALFLAEENGRYLLAKQNECERFRQHAFRLDELSARQDNVLKRRLLRSLAESYLSASRSGGQPPKMRHIVIAYLWVLVPCVVLLFFACKILLEQAPPAFADIVDTGVSAINESGAVHAVIIALLLGSGTLWTLWELYRHFTR